MTDLLVSVGFRAWLETTDDRRPLSDYKSVLEGTLILIEETEAKLERYQRREAGEELCESHEDWLPMEDMHLTEDGVWLCDESYDELVAEARTGPVPAINAGG